MIESANEFIELVDSSDPSDRKRWKNEEAPVEVWLDIVRNYPHMRFAVVGNRVVPCEVLLEMVDDPDRRVRMEIALKRQAGSEILEMLSWDHHDSVLLAVAGNENTPTVALHRLAGATWGKVRERALRQLEARGVL